MPGLVTSGGARADYRECRPRLQPEPATRRSTVGKVVFAREERDLCKRFVGLEAWVRGYASGVGHWCVAGVAGVQACLPLGRLPAVLVALFLAALIILAAFLAALIRTALFIFASLLLLSRAALFVLFILATLVRAALVRAALVVLAAVIRAALFILVTMGRGLLLQYVEQVQKCCEVGGWRGAPYLGGTVATVTCVRALWSCGWRC